MNDKRLFIISNRLPITISGEGDQAQINPSTGGLVTAINSYVTNGKHDYAEIYWAGVPGCSQDTWNLANRKIKNSSYKYLPVIVEKQSYEKYYNGFSNSSLWPLFHYFPSFAEYEPACFDEYIRVNQQFAEVLKKNLRAGDTLWIHDYHLLPLAGILREQMPELSIGFFLHIPFPSYEIFRLLPKKWQEVLLEGLLGADLIGFHTIDYAGHFLQTVQTVLGLDNERHVIRFKSRLVKVDVFPIGIDYQAFHNAFDDLRITAMRESMIKKMHGRKIIFSVDRLDYSKGVHNRLKAYQTFLQQNPEYHNKVVFIMVIVPSRNTILKYAERKRIIDEMISHINSEIGNIHWQPVIYQYNCLTFEEMLTLYTSCHLALITPLRDGMNLVSKEFVASRKDGKGVLVLSEMAGAARELTDALTINPNDVLETALKIKTGLEMPLEEQALRLSNMQRRLSNYDVQAWADDFMGELHNIKQRQSAFQVKFLDDYSRRNILDAYRNATDRLLLIDYDGTLVPFASSPDLAFPGEKVIELIMGLTKTPGNDVYLISGRSSGWLDKHFGQLKVNLIAEHGARRRKKEGTWKTEVQGQNEWKERVHNIMEMYVRRCAHSFVEEKDFSIVWHYRNSSAEQGKLRALELSGELHDSLQHQHLEVLMGNKIIEVRNRGINKGTAIKKILSKNAYDFIFAVGDDKTDEDMFKLLRQNERAFTIKVGPEASFAHFNLYTPHMVVSFLDAMQHVNVLPPVVTI